MEEGAPGATCMQPVLPPECEGYNDNDWAKWFLKKGGFGDASPARARDDAAGRGAPRGGGPRATGR